MPRRFHKWLIGIAGGLLALAVIPLNDRLIKAHPSVLWLEAGAMLVAMFVAQYRRELEKRQQNED